MKGHSISDNIILDLLVDSSNNLWIGTLNGGINKTTLNSKKFITHNKNPYNPNSLTDNIINAIYKDTKGNLWVGTNSGLEKYSSKNETWKNFHQKINGERVNTIYEDSQSTIWIGTDSGLRKFQSENNEFILYPHFSIYDILVDSYGSFLIASSEGLFTFDLLAKK